MNKDLNRQSWSIPTAQKGNGDMINPKKGEDSAVDREQVAVAKSRQKAIGRALQRMYDDVVQEPVPDDFTDLLRQIDESAKRSGS